MARHTTIEWTENTWNPVTGCSKISDGCKHCYAERLAIRLQAMRHLKYRDGFKLTLHPQNLNEPSTWKKPQMTFVCSMGDLFHEDVPTDFLMKVFAVMNGNKHHIFQVLTKRSKRFAEIIDKVEWGDNIWTGVTIEDAKYIHRINDLLKVPSKTKFLSLEPLLSDMRNLPLQGIDWVIVGGESGIGARPIELKWVTNIRDQCLQSNVSFFFKQWGGVKRKTTGNILEGKQWKQMPKRDAKEQSKLFC